MFEYHVTTTDGKTTKIIAEHDPTKHPTFYNRVLSVKKVDKMLVPKVVSDIEKRFDEGEWPNWIAT